MRTSHAALLALSPDGAGPLTQAWRAYLADDPALLATPADPDFEFPFRRESLAVLQWADEQSSDWTWTYLRGLNLWAMERPAEAAVLLRGLGDAPDFAPFYATRATLPDVAGIAERVADFRHAVALAPQIRLLHVDLVGYLLEEGRWDDALEALADARARFPDDFNLALFEARALVNTDRAADAVEILENVHVLPSEHARGTHALWEQAHTMMALVALDAGDDEVAAAHLGAALEWPETLGQGRPYEPEERLVHYLLGKVAARAGNAEQSQRHYEAVIVATGEVPAASTGLDLLALDAQRAGSLDPADYPGLFDDLEGQLILRALQIEGGRR